MATVFENVKVSLLGDDGEFVKKYDTNIKIEIRKNDSNVFLAVSNGTESLLNFDIENNAEVVKVGDQAVVLSVEPKPMLLRLASPKDQASFCHHLKEAIKKYKKSVFNERTDSASAEQYFQFYGYLSQQQNMMQDYIRTSTYQRAMLDNTADFIDKVVMDVGAGSGILSFFAVQAGAKKVYAVEASSMAKHCETLVKNSKLGDKIQVIAGKIEEIDIPEKVDIIISEPMGYMLYNERMLETYLHAKKWLKEDGKMFPTMGDLHIAPFTDESLYMEQYSKANFWYQPSFHGVDLCSLRDAAVQEYFKQPIVDTFDIRICLAKSQKHTVDFQTAHETDLHNIQIPVNFTIMQSGNIHGLAFWFDVAFIGSQSTVWLSTSPTQPLTHWYQVRCMLREPLFLKQGQTLLGKVKLRANTRQSYDVDIELNIPGTTSKSSNTLDLKNPFFRYTGQQPQPPPGTNEVSPSDAYWTQQELQTHQQQTQQQQQTVQIQGNSYNLGSLLNGGMGDAQILLQQQGASAVVNNVVPIVPVNPGSIPAPGALLSVGSAASQALQTRASVGGGVSPIAFISQSQNGNSSSTPFSVSQQFMIGDYAVPGNIQVQPAAAAASGAAAVDIGSAGSPYRNT